MAEQWDPARDEAAGEACRAYGAGGIMHLPGRLHITWENDTTLKLETDTGQQTRIFSFGSRPAAGETTLQGFVAAHGNCRAEDEGAAWCAAAANPGRPGTSIRVETTHAAGLLSPERRALRRERTDDRVVHDGRPSPMATRTARDQDPRGSAIHERSIRADGSVQEAARRTGGIRRPQFRALSRM